MIYLFLSFAVIWIGFFIYNFYLIGKLNKLERDLEILQEYLKDKPK